MDVYDKNKRSQVMRSVKSKDTGAEMRVRRALHAAGYRYRLHRKDLPGKPDIVFPSRRKVLLVQGCFWHQHPHCPHAARPASSSEYWTRKLDGNIARDQRNFAALLAQGWTPYIVWECQLKNLETLLIELRAFLDSPESPPKAPQKGSSSCP